MPDSPLSEMMSSPGEIEDFPTNGLRIEEAPFHLEKAYDYEPGGHHRVHLGDTFGSGRYRVIHKLGNGGLLSYGLAKTSKPMCQNMLPSRSSWLKPLQTTALS